MKKIILAGLVLLVAITGKSQFIPGYTIQGSLQQGTDPRTLDVLYLPSYTSDPGEYISYVSISIAVPTVAIPGGLNPTITGVGNFTSMSLVPALPFSYVAGDQTIFSWVYGGGPTSMSWTAGESFIGARITMDGDVSNTASQVRLVDFTSTSGGANSNTYFIVYTNSGTHWDANDPSALFFDSTGVNGSTLGTDVNGGQYAQSNAFIVLPVNLTSFSGYKNGSKNTLEWNTASESNNRGFDVQRSTDGVTYNSIGFVASLASDGNSSAALHYSYNDNTATGSKNYYRLRQVDIDNKSKLSNIVVINSNAAATALAITGTRPNPATSVLNVLIDAPARESLTLLLHDLTGKLVKQQLAEVSQGSNIIPVDISGLAKGTYIIKFEKKSSGSELFPVRFVKQ